MVRRQLRARRIIDRRVLDAFGKVPRHLFVPECRRGQAYEDYPLSIGEGQTISQPYMVALMTERLELKGDERVLEVGTGSGYQTAILAELCESVVTIERFGMLSVRAKETLDSLGYANITYCVGDGTRGVEKHAPYDRIIVTASSPDVPQPLIDQLADSGLIVIPVGRGFSQDLLVVRREGADINTEFVCKCVFVPLVGKYGFPE